jgi:hypothetical protein
MEVESRNAVWLNDRVKALNGDGMLLHACNGKTSCETNHHQINADYKAMLVGQFLHRFYEN